MLFLIFALLFPAKTTSYLCLLGCTSNCCDGVSVCNLDDQTCSNDCNGGCINFETTTWLETIFDWAYYETIFSTVQTYTTAETTWEYDTVWSTELDTYTHYSTEYDTVTVTANVPTVTQPVTVTAKDYARLYGALLLAPRQLICTDNCYYSTKIIEITKISTSYTGTTTTYQTSYDYYTPTFSSTSTVMATFTTYNDVTVWDTSTYTTTVDADAVTVYVTTTQQPPSTVAPAAASSTAPGSQLPASQSGDVQPPVSGPHPTVSAVGANSKTTAMSIDTSAALAELQSAVPMTAQTNPSAACFLQTSYKRCYTTPTWWTSLPSDAKSYFAAINAANTAACTSCANSTSSGSVLSPGAKAGIGIGTVAGVAALGGLVALLLLKFGFIGGSSAAGTAAGGSQMAHTGGSSAAPTGNVGSSAANPGWSGMVGDPSGGGWSGVVGSGTGAAPPAPPLHHPIVPIPIIAGMRSRTESGGAQSPRDSSYAASAQSQRIVPRRPVPESGAQSPVSLRSGVTNPFESQAVYSGTLVGGRAAGELSGGERSVRELPGTERSARELSGVERQVSELSEFSEERQTGTGSPSEFASRWS